MTMENRALLIQQYFKLRRIANLSNKKPNEATELTFEIQDFVTDRVMYVRISQTQKIRLCLFELARWQPCYLIGVPDLEIYFCSILNKHLKDLNTLNINDLITEGINFLFASE